MRHNFSYVTEGTPQREASQSVLKYIGAGKAPEWMDIEPGIVVGFNDSVMGTHAQGRTDKFEILCNIRADLSSAPYETERGKTGTISYTRKFDVILLVGLTELKAQIAWVDSVTVSTRGILSRLRPFLIVMDSGGGEKVRNTVSGVPVHCLNSIFRSDAVVVYDNPSEDT